MIYITGDTHIPVDIQKLSTKRFTAQRELGEKDYLIICGDFGGVFCGDNEELYWRKWLDSKNFTTLFVDGNHENFDLLREFPTVDFCEGKAQKIGDKIYHLMRGEIFNIDGYKIFTLGGGESHDKECRTIGKNWWREELPSKEEYKTALENLGSSGWKADIVITHCAPTSVQKTIDEKYKQNELTDFLQSIKDKLIYEKRFFGHYHIDAKVDEKHFALYNDVINLAEYK